MIRLQEVRIETNKKCSFSIHLVENVANKTDFSREVDVFDFVSNHPGSYRISTKNTFPTPIEALEDGLNQAKNYSKNSHVTICVIDNPCNCELVSKKDQQDLVRKLNLSAQVTENGSTEDGS